MKRQAMKKIILSITTALSAAAVFTSALMPAVYAVNDNSSDVLAVEDEGSSEKITFEENESIITYKNGRALAADKDGMTYYLGGDDSGTVFYCTDSSGEVRGSYRIDNTKGEHDEIIGVKTAEIKIRGEHVYIYYSTGVINYFTSGTTGRFILKLDRDMNKVGEYDLSKLTIKPLDNNEEKIFFIRGGKIYMSDFDGTNRKAIYAADGSDGAERIYSIAATDKYIGFQGCDSMGSIDYYGVVSLETGEATVKRSDRKMNQQVSSYSDRLIWTDYTEYIISEGNGEIQTDPHSDNKIHIFDGSDFTDLKTESSNEHFFAADSDGRIITADIRTKGKESKTIFKVYSHGKLEGSYETFTDSFVCFAANGGTIAVTSTVIPEGADSGYHRVAEGDPLNFETFPIVTRIIRYKAVS